MKLAPAHNGSRLRLRLYRTMPVASALREPRDGSGDGGLPAPSRQGRLLPVR
ncbi:MAG: hypothetical protein M3008_12575 [Chloroflexota bacterium]|nr:hypothetical protein [Chloroflexota bacterium]